jgi:flagellar biosynthesis protein FlhF
MRTRSYFAESVQDAIERARTELGPEAMLIQSRKTDPEFQHLGAYEVVFGTANHSETRANMLSKGVNTPAAAPIPDMLVRGIADLRRELETVRRSVSRQRLHAHSAGANRISEFEDMHIQLLGAEFSEDIAQELVQALEARIQNRPGRHHLSFDHAELPQSATRPRRRRKREVEEKISTLAPLVTGVPDALRTALFEELEHRIQVAPGLGNSQTERRLAMFVGPPGSGKTTNLVKLALTYGLAARTPCQILSTDTLRLGGSEQLAAYAGIIGAGFQALHTIAALEQALEECRTKKLVLIDTPGYALGNIDEAAELALFVSRNPDIDVHLVVPATLRSSALSRIVERFAILRPSRILFTHLDDVASPGVLLDHTLRVGLPVSYLSHGQQVPEDIEEASYTRLIAGLTAHVQAAHVSAA